MASPNWISLDAADGLGAELNDVNVALSARESATQPADPEEAEQHEEQEPVLPVGQPETSQAARVATFMGAKQSFRIVDLQGMLGLGGSHAWARVWTLAFLEDTDA